MAEIVYDVKMGLVPHSKLLVIGTNMGTVGDRLGLVVRELTGEMYPGYPGYM